MHDLGFEYSLHVGVSPPVRASAQLRLFQGNISMTPSLATRCSLQARNSRTGFVALNPFSAQCRSQSPYCPVSDCHSFSPVSQNLSFLARFLEDCGGDYLPAFPLT